jgi:1-pyrroline-5-carboxylate dehydrogenase
VSVVAEQLLRLLHHCGMPASDVDLLVGPGPTMGQVCAVLWEVSKVFRFSLQRDSQLF